MHAGIVTILPLFGRKVVQAYVLQCFFHFIHVCGLNSGSTSVCTLTLPQG